MALSRDCAVFSVFKVSLKRGLFKLKSSSFTRFDWLETKSALVK
jgi:hypothetical protein